MTNETKDIEKIVDKRLKALLLANSKISELPPSVALTGPELLAIVQSAETRQATMNQIRDFIELEAVAPAFAKFGFVGNATETVIATQGVPVKVAGTYVSGALQLFTHVGGTATYTGVLTRQFQVAAYTTATLNLVSGDISLFIAKQSAVITTSPQSPDLDGTTPSFIPISIGDIVTLSTGETIEIFVQNNTGTQNITHKDLTIVLGAPGFTGAAVADLTIQDTWVESLLGNINLNDGTKTFTVRQADETTEILTVHQTENITMKGTNLQPTKIQGLGGNVGILEFVDTRNTTAGSTAAISCKATPFAGGPSFFSTFNFNIIAQNKNSGFERTRLFWSNIRDGSLYTLLDWDADRQAVLFGDSIVPPLFDTAEIAARNKESGMIVNNSDDNRLEYYDAGAAAMKKIANLDDIIPGGGSSGIPVLNVTGSTGGKPCKAAYNKGIARDRRKPDSGCKKTGYPTPQAPV